MPEARNIAIKRTISRKSATAQQIDMAILLFYEDEYARSTTFALAAEGSLPDSVSNKAYLSGLMKDAGTNKEIVVIKIPNWLKLKRNAEKLALGSLMFLDQSYEQ